MIDDKQEILGVKLTSSSRKEVLGKLVGVLGTEDVKGLVTVFTPNPEQVVQASTDDVFRSVLNRSTVTVADGVGLAWAGKVLGKRIERIAGIDLAEELVKICAEGGVKVMLLGGSTGVAQKAKEKILDSKSEILSNIEDQNSKFEILAVSGAKQVEKESSAERKKVLAKIATFKPALLLVAYGAPWQEKWVDTNSAALEKAGVRVTMVVGGTFDVWAGEIKRAPLMWQRMGLEWLWRLGLQPWRWRRQLRLVRFVGMVLKERFL